MKLSTKEILESYRISEKDFLKKLHKFHIPVSSAGWYKTELIEKYFGKKVESLKKSGSVNSSKDGPSVSSKGSPLDGQMDGDIKMTRTIAVSNQKGGEGKTTVSLFLADALAKKKKVLLVDWDAQANATRMFVNDPPDKGIFECLAYRKTKPLQVSEVLISVSPNLDLAPSSISLANLTTPMEFGDFHLLKEALSPLSGQYDFIIIDCPPSLGLALENALIAAQFLLVPIQTRAFSVQGIQDLHATFEKIKAKANPKLTLLGAVFNQYEESRALAGLAVHIKKYFPVFRAVIPKREIIPQSQARRELLNGCDSKTRKYFFDFAAEIEEKVVHV